MRFDLGATLTQKGVHFKVWAPNVSQMQVEVEGKGVFDLIKETQGYCCGEFEGIQAGDRYSYILENGQKRPDPVSLSLPCGVHGPTEIVSHEFPWQDFAWQGIEIQNYIFYELHVGTFSEEGTFAGVLKKLDHLLELGVTCIEVMPIAEFAGRWNWGYDGASLYAAYSGYGGLKAFQHFVDVCHSKGMAVCLDVVYNHLGPEGNYLSDFGPYFSETYHTPWGKAFNYDGAYSDEVRHFIIQNALFWIEVCHVDCLRLDAVHGIFDRSATPMLSELCEQVKRMAGILQRKVHVIAESDLHDSRVVRPVTDWGLGFSALWNDDFHHALHVALTKEKQSYYIDFKGFEDLAKVICSPLYQGQYSEFRKQRHGNAFDGISWEHYVVFCQNHDQIGNRAFGERLTTLVEKAALKLAACLYLLSPGLPLLFMGEEYGEKNPFEYFVDYQDEKLMQAIVEGRKKEFHKKEMPYPGVESFLRSRLSWDQDPDMFKLYRMLIAIRKAHTPKAGLTRQEFSIYLSETQEWVAWEYPTIQGEWLGCLCHFGQEAEITLPFRQVKNQIQLMVGSGSLERGSSWKSWGQSALVLK